MIIEGAFLKIPEVLLNYDDRDGLYEANNASLLANSIVLEFNARNIDNPLMKIQLEKRYKKKENIRCDLYANFDFVSKDLEEYGYFKENWIEAKYFGSLERTEGSETKSENAGSIMYDLYRLIKNTDKNVRKGLYLLVILSHDPRKYLAFNRKDKTKRDWLYGLLNCGTNDIRFNLDEEPECIKKMFNHEKDLQIKVKTRTLLFEPLKENQDNFYGYLIQILP